jgi:hypothetical protein
VTLKRIPIWVRWMLASLLLWCAWGLGVRPAFTHRLNLSEQQHSASDRELAVLRSQIGLAPAVLQRIDSSRTALDSCLASYSGTESADELMDQLRASGSRHELTDLRAEPELSSLLRASGSRGTRQSGQVHLDTLLVALSARGQFLALGSWLDEVEGRSDFRTWVLCHWSHSEVDNQVQFEGKAILLTANRDVSASRPVNSGM